MNKKWYSSKTIWVNVIATAAIIVQVVTDKNIIASESQVAILSIVNLVLRIITKEKIEW